MLVSFCVIVSLAGVSGLPLVYPTFTTWAKKFDRTYYPTERDYRESVYNNNLIKIVKHNNHNHSYWFTANKFADLTSEEFATMYISGGYKNQSVLRNIDWSLVYNKKISVLPASVDWTTSGAVTPVKDQGQCGSCWAFSTTGSTESAWFLKNGTLVSLSEQQLVDCSTKEGNQGCNGGLMDYGFQYIIDNKGITSEIAYPYNAVNGICKTDLPVVATIKSFKNVPTNSEIALLTAISQQPVSVAVEADQDSFQLYGGGVMTTACGTNLDHGVLAVGYGTLSGQDYYLVKNSWGSDWGVNGYIMLGRGAKFGTAGQCGIQMDPSYPVV